MTTAHNSAAGFAHFESLPPRRNCAKIFTVPFFFEIAEMRIAAPDAAFSDLQAGKNVSNFRAVKL
jgi:hypothetical protein